MLYNKFRIIHTLCHSCQTSETTVGKAWIQSTTVERRFCFVRFLFVREVRQSLYISSLAFNERMRQYSRAQIFSYVVGKINMGV